MDHNQIDKAVSTRARVRISERNGYAKGHEGIAMGYRAAYDNIKIGFVDTNGQYTGEYTMVNIKHVDLITDDTTPTTTHVRTENGTTQLITTRQALDEINAGMMAPTKKLVREMSASRSTAHIEYRDGRKVTIRPATTEEIAALTTTTETTADGRRIVTANGKRYIIANHISQPTVTTIGGVERTWPGGVKYWAERNGKTFGPTRQALANSKPGTVSAAIWATANQAA